MAAVLPWFHLPRQHLGKERTMTQQWTPLNKQSKKAQKEFHKKQRGSWYGLNPVTRTAPNRKAYDRNKLKQAERKAGRTD